MERMDQVQFGAVCMQKPCLGSARVGVGFGTVELLSLWYRRWTTRRHLEKLSLRDLRDIGIDPIAAEQEAGKPFWMA